MNNGDNEWLRGRPLVLRTVLGRSGFFRAARRHHLRAASADVTARRSHHAGPSIRTGWRVTAGFPWQMDIVVRLPGGRDKDHPQDKRQRQQKLHLFRVSCNSRDNASHRIFYRKQKLGLHGSVGKATYRNAIEREARSQRKVSYEKLHMYAHITYSLPAVVMQLR